MKKHKSPNIGGGFFDYELRMQAVKKKPTSLDRLNEIIPWDLFAEELSELFSQRQPKGLGGKPPFDRLLMFKILILQRYYNLSDEQMEYQINDRLSFQAFLGIQGAQKVPDQNTIWDFRELLKELGGVDRLFARFDKFLAAENVVAKEGVIVDASFIEVPKQRNSRDENSRIKEGEIPEEWKNEPGKLKQKDTDARWTKKNNVSYYGYKNHIKVDIKSKLVRTYKVTNASVHDSQILEELLDDDDGVVYADSAYRSEGIESSLGQRGIKSRIHEKATRSKALSEKQKAANREKSKTRARVEHVFGFMENSMKDNVGRYIGTKRTEAMAGMKNLVYNLFRYEQIKRLNLVPS